MAWRWMIIGNAVAAALIGCGADERLPAATDGGGLDAQTAPDGAAPLGMDAQVSMDGSSEDGSPSSDAAAAQDSGAPNETGTVCHSGPNLPPGWSQTDIGNPAPGLASLDGCDWTVEGGGILHDVATDDFHFVYRSAADVSSIRVRIDQVQPGGNGAGQVGIMFREGTAPGGRYVYLVWDNEMGSLFLERSIRSRVNVVPTANYYEGPSLPYWLRIDFDGRFYRFYGSTNGESWLSFGSPYEFCECEEGPLVNPLVGIGVASQTGGSSVASAELGQVILH